MPLTVAIMGRRAAFHGIAACRLFGTDATWFEQPHFDGVVGLVASGQAERGLMAWDNTLAGPIPGNRARLRASGLYAVGEARLPIRLHLLGLPGASPEALRKVRSHPMALKESRRFLDGLTAEREAWGDTASAAESVADAADPRLGAIASLTAARQFHLEVLAEGIEDHADNVTRFLVLAREPQPATGPLVVLGAVPGAAAAESARRALEREGWTWRRQDAEGESPSGEALLHLEFRAPDGLSPTRAMERFRRAAADARPYGAFPPGPTLGE